MVSRFTLIWPEEENFADNAVEAAEEEPWNPRPVGQDVGQADDESADRLSTIAEGSQEDAEEFDAFVTAYYGSVDTEMLKPLREVYEAFKLEPDIEQDEDQYITPEPKSSNAESNPEPQRARD